MRSAARTVAVSAPALVVLAVAWLRLEAPHESLWRVLALLALALVAAVPRPRWVRVACAVVVTVAAAQVAVGVDLVPWRLGDPAGGFGLSDSFSTLGTRFGNGFTDFYGTHLPFDPRVHAAMNELVLSGLFVFALGIALAVTARKPVVSALVLLMGAGWPATLLGPSRGVAMGAAILGAELVVLAGLGSRRIPALALPAAAVVAVAAVAVGSATAARHGLVHWQSWNLAHVAGGPADVGFVWNAQYGGLNWSGHPTTVLQVRSARAPTYLRATVLDDFQGDAWVVGPTRSADSLEPPAARRARNQTREDVTVADLADSHLVGGSIPIRFESQAPLEQLEPGFASLNQDLPRGFRYSVWSYTPHTTPAALRRSPPQYPSALEDEGLLDVGAGLRLPPFGTPDRSAAVVSLVATRPELRPYLPLVRVAERLGGRARTPYGAVSTLENWFVSSGVFRYSNHPTMISPPLVGFVTTTHSGYCQYFAGAMALMLRYLGIPARVAVGFAGGSYDSRQHVWNVTDREAHAWVEVWFEGYGWLPFDPTPAAPGAAPRRTQAGTRTGPGGGGAGPPVKSAKGGAKGNALTAIQKLRTIGASLRRRGRGASPATGLGVGTSGGSGDRSRPLLLLLAGLAAVLGSIVLAKAGFGLARRARRDPRGVAAACRQELTSFLLDQRIEVPPSATLADLGELVKHELGVDPELFVAAATAARFGPAEDAASAAVRARRALRTLLDAARRTLTRRERLRGLLSLRSLARAMAPVDASAAAGTGMGGA